jgi:hypothetical protein
VLVYAGYTDLREGCAYASGSWKGGVKKLLGKFMLAIRNNPTYLSNLTVARQSELDQSYNGHSWHQDVSFVLFSALWSTLEWRVEKYSNRTPMKTLNPVFQRI